MLQFKKEAIRFAKGESQKRVDWIELCFIKRTKFEWLHRNVKNRKVWKGTADLTHEHF